MNKLSTQRRVAIVGALIEGNSVRSTCRMTGASIHTVLKLLVDMGTVCAKYQDAAFRNLTCKRIQCDEIWSFVGAKDKNIPADRQGEIGIGSAWTWTAIDADTKLIPSWFIGGRDGGSATEFIQDLAGRLANRVQLTTDGHRVYLDAVEDAFGGNVDYAMLVKLYGSNPESETRYSPAECIGCRTVKISGNPEPKNISTSYVERQNLTMRMSMRRFTRLTNGFSKKIENHAAAVALHFMNYNFCRIHQTLRVTPAMEAGLTDHVWSLQEVISLLDRQIAQIAA